MLDCLILGDSIAVGVGQARPACNTSARVGIGSAAFLQTMFPAAPKAARHVVISLGVNDDAGAATLENLRRLRGAVVANQVTWLLPGLKDAVRRQIRTVAAEHGDRLVDTISQVGPDHLHPGSDGYRQIASWAEQGTSGPAAPPTASAPQPRSYAAGPLLIPMPGSNPPRHLVGLPQVQTPGSIYGAWPASAAPFAAIPPRDYAFRAFVPLAPVPVPARPTVLR